MLEINLHINIAYTDQEVDIINYTVSAFFQKRLIYFFLFSFINICIMIKIGKIFIFNFVLQFTGTYFFCSRFILNIFIDIKEYNINVRQELF